MINILLFLIDDLKKIDEEINIDNQVGLVDYPGKSNVRIIVSINCENCGGDIAVKVLDRKPSLDKIRSNESEIGGLGCVRTFTPIAEINGESVTNFE